MDNESLAIFQLLASCIAAASGPERTRQLAQAASRLSDWTNVATAAESQGMAPLLAFHLQAAGVRPPQPARRQLQGLRLRHRRASQIRTQVLAEILAAYSTAGIQALVVKGAALAHLIYEQPELRPMADIDILVSRSDARRAQQLLAELDFQAPLPSNGRLPDKHLAVARRPVGGMVVSVEIHHNLFDADYPASLELSDLAGEPLAFPLADTGLESCTLAPEEMLWHLCQHLTLNATVFRSIRLIWMVDVVSFAGRFASAIDWRQVNQHYPLVTSTLSLLNAMSPLSATLQAKAGLKSSIIGGIGLDFEGWPRSSLASQRQKGWQRILGNTFRPSEWWLRLHYGLGSGRALFWHRWLIHPLHILGWVQQLLLERLGLRRRL